MIFIRTGPVGGPKIVEMEDREASRQIRQEFAEAEPLGVGLVLWFNQAEGQEISTGDFTKDWPKLVDGDTVITGMKDGMPAGIPDLDIALEKTFRLCRYELADELNNVWRCRHCGHLEQLEADGPFENGWKRCPHCGLWILEPEEVEV